MKTKILSIIITAIIFSGCTDPVEKANETINKRLDAVLSDDIEFVSSSLFFLNYAVATNYWYSEETTYREIVDDNFDNGIYGLKELKSRANSIITSDESINGAIEELNTVIDSTLAALKKKKQASESLNGLFGLMLFGGTSGAMDMVDAFSTPEEKEKYELEMTRMPPRVLAAFDNLVEMLQDKFYRSVPYEIDRLETEAIDGRHLNFNQHDDIRINLKQKIKEKIINQYNNDDLKARDRMINELFSAYNDRYPITEN